MKPVRIYSEGIFLVAMLLLSLAVSMVTAADFGVSMIVAPAYILSQKLGVITFGQSEYILQGLMFVLFCLLMRRVRLVYFASFATCLIYGLVLDSWRTWVPLFNPTVTPPGSMDWPVRLALFVGGVLLTSFSVALFFHTYLYPQVYDFFVKGISRHFGRDLGRFKTIFDLSFLTAAVVMTLVFFGKFVGVGIGTLVITCINGTVIGWCDKWLTRHVECVPLFPRLAAHFESGLE